jgi:cytochrome c
MKRTAIAIASVLATAFFQGAVYAQKVDAKKAEALAKQSTCLNCHTVEAKKVGPSFKEVSKKYKGSNADKLVAELKAKPVHQAAAKATKEADLKTIAGWILSL